MAGLCHGIADIQGGFASPPPSICVHFGAAFIAIKSFVRMRLFVFLVMLDFLRRAPSQIINGNALTVRIRIASDDKLKFDIGSLNAADFVYILGGDVIPPIRRVC